METEKAIQLVDDRMCYGRGQWSKHHQPERDMYWEAGEAAINALKKQEPGILIQQDPLDENVFHLRCPHCRVEVGHWNGFIKMLAKNHKNMKFCMECGQAIQWDNQYPESE